MRPLVWLSRFRHRRGYGVHSPFAFGFITDVVYNRGEYYAYAELREQRLAKIKDESTKRGKDSAKRLLREKDDRLLFRLINFAAPSTALVFGPDARLSLPYLQAGRRHCQFFTDEPEASAPTNETAASVLKVFSSEKPLDFLYTTTSEPWSDLFARATALASPTACFVVHGIHRTRRDLQAWRTLTADSRIRVTFDLYDFGIAFFHPRLHKQDYTVCYY